MVEQLTNLFFIRHGEAFSNVDNTVAGMRSDRGLTLRGVKQAQALARRLAADTFVADVVYASTMPRARQTAEILAPVLQRELVFNDELHELRPGDADGWTFEQIFALPTFEAFASQIDVPIAPNGESWGVFHQRIATAIDQIIATHAGQRVVLVVHGGVIETASMHLLGLGPTDRQRISFQCYNTAITRWRQNRNIAQRLEWQMVTHNDHAHLLTDD